MLWISTLYKHSVSRCMYKIRTVNYDIMHWENYMKDKNNKQNIQQNNKNKVSNHMS